LSLYLALSHNSKPISQLWSKSAVKKPKVEKVLARADAMRPNIIFTMANDLGNADLRVCVRRQPRSRRVGKEKVTGNLLYWGFALSVLLVYLVLAGQYESWILPLAVISAVPLALLGPATTLTSLGVDNNLYVQIGLMLLIALSAKNGMGMFESRGVRFSGA
jgi:hypothetical protein